MALTLGSTDYLLARLSRLLADELVTLGDLETRRLGERLQQTALTKPVFIAGLARSGTTILLTVLAALEGVATHRYRDFPFVFTPSFWEGFQSRFANSGVPVERPHQDRILITKESPEAFEEPIWQHFFPFVHAAESCHVLDRRTQNPAFEDFFATHLRKIVLLRGGDRYLSKGNYNITRLDYLGRLFEDARFLTPIRHPFTHVPSLVRQHEQFLGYARQDARVGRYLEIAGHYEFGPQRVPVHVTAESCRRIVAAWQAGEELRGYAILWADVYHYLHSQLGGDLAPRIMTVRFETLCAEPESTLAEITAFAGLEGRRPRTADGSPAIAAPPAAAALTPAEADVIWQEAGPTAELFGYTAT